jgi:hypothetical protein
MKVESKRANTLPKGIKEEWESILLGNPLRTPFLTPLWAEVWLRHFGKSLDPWLICFRDDDGSLQGLGFFLESSRDGDIGLTLLGSRDVWDYRDLVIRPGKEEEIFRSLGRFFGENQWSFIELDGIAEASPTAKAFPAIMDSFGYRTVKENDETVIHLSLPATWEDFLMNLNGKDRHELRRKIRRIEKEGSCEFAGVSDASALDEKLGIFLELHRRSRRDKSEFMTSEMEAYFRELARGLWEQGWLDLSFLRFRGKEVAAFFAFDFAGVKFVYNSGYDPDFAWYSPGIVLAGYCIRGAIEKGMAGFNFLRGREEYKYHLGGREETNYRLYTQKR